MGRAERRLLGGVAAAQIALTLALLVGAGLLIQTVHSLAKVRPGYDTQNILTMSVTAVGTNWLDFHTQAIGARRAAAGSQGGGVRLGRAPDRQQMEHHIRDRRPTRDGRAQGPSAVADAFRDAGLLRRRSG